MAAAIDAYLIVGGKYHDVDFVRLELLRLLAEHEKIRVRVGEDYRDKEAIGRADLLVTYTCDVVPVGGEIEGPRRFLARGRRWFALHGTNSRLNIAADGNVKIPPLDPEFCEMLGSQFMAHPPIGRYKVRSKKPDHPLIAGIGDFHVEDEHYLQDHLPGNEALLVSRFSGPTPLFERATWPDGEHMVLYLRKTGGGEVLYFTLGHARGRFDMRPLADYYPLVERGAWQLPVYCELLRRGIRWAMPAS